MEASPDSRICDLVRKRRHVGPTVGNAGCRRAGRCDLGNVYGSERSPNDTRDGAAQDAVRTWIFRMHRSGSDWLPDGLTICRGIAVYVTVADGRDGTPEV